MRAMRAPGQGRAALRRSTKVRRLARAVGRHCAWIIWRRGGRRDRILASVVERHGAWIRGEREGERANLGGADLSKANLHGAYLGGAGLRNANLHCANLHGATGNMAEVRSLQVDTYQVVYTATHLQIGCQCHSIKAWWAFSSESIGEMDPRGKPIEWWATWKPILKQIIQQCPATPTGKESA